MTAQYIIGIDLGTTNSTVAYIDRKACDSLIDPSDVVVNQFLIEQVIQNGVLSSLSVLPSFLYIPTKEEREAGIAELSWDKTLSYCIGKLAKERISEVPHRGITSAKSWLSFQGAALDETLFPLELHEEERELQKTIPEVVAAFLSHIKNSWDLAKPDSLFEQQSIVITVPASFDPSAREQIKKAAATAGFPKDVLLLEEPLAAFYDWLHRNQPVWREEIQIGDTILVVDIGGGTTDFSLIEAEEENGNLSLKRVSVGSHLLLGGDNLDLAIAFFARQRLEEEGHALDEWQFQKLVRAAVDAKETLLGEAPPEKVELTIAGRGKKLIGGSLKTSITKEEVQTLVIDGFLPMIPPSEQSKTEKHSALQHLGLPYAQDPRISAQLAKFLSQTGETDSGSLEKFVVPTKVLFNGGTTKALQLRERILDILNSWSQSLGGQKVVELQNSDPDFAVSRGASYYQIIKDKFSAIRVKSAIARSYFIGVSKPMPAIPGMEPPIEAICIAPFGMEEGATQQLENKKFYLLLGEPAEFRFFSRSASTLSNGVVCEMGTKVSSWKQELTELAPIEVRLSQSESSSAYAEVSLRSKVTELGTLELFFEEKEHTWDVSFNVRH